MRNPMPTLSLSLNGWISRHWSQVFPASKKTTPRSGATIGNCCSSAVEGHVAAARVADLAGVVVVGGVRTRRRRVESIAAMVRVVDRPDELLRHDHVVVVAAQRVGDAAAAEPEALVGRHARSWPAQIPSTPTRARTIVVTRFRNDGR